MSFDIMEACVKARSPKEALKPGWEKPCASTTCPDWYIESCRKIKYMFP